MQIQTRTRAPGRRAPARPLVLALMCAIAMLALPAVASAATYTVNTTSDNAPSSGECSGVAGDCSLRQAVDKANADSTNDTIVVPAGDYKLTIPGANENNDATGDLDVNKASGTLTITGGGARSTTIDASGLGDRILEVVAGTANISGFTLTGGSPPSSDTVSGDGGAINNDGTLTLSDSTVTGNTSPDDGGGVASSGSSAVSTTLVGDTFTQNTAAYWGGAVDIDYGAETITNTTMTNNTAADGGGAVDIDTGGTVQFTNDTIAANHTGTTTSTGDGGGIWFSGSNVQFANTIVANNTGATATTTDCAASNETDQGHNLDNSGTCFTPSSTNGDINANPKLGPLQNNGGQTDTLALLDGSPAINAGDNLLCPATDQRGVTRPQPAGGTCDIGAYEATPPAAATGAATGITTKSATLNGTVNPENLTTTYHFEWGTSTAYGHTTTDTGAGAGNTAENEAAAISGLMPGTLYHYRIVATNAIGTSVGADHTFKTKKPPYSGAYAPGQSDHVKGGAAHVKVVCPHGTSGSCTGTLRLLYRGRAIGTAHVHIRSGRAPRLTVRLSARGRRLLGRTGRLRVTARVQSHDRFGTRRTRSHAITLVGAAVAAAPAPTFTG